MNNKAQTQKEKGYILLLAILLTSIFLSISFSIYAITIKELILASFLRDSQKALSAADRGSMCALYWDNNYRTTALNKTIFPNNTSFIQHAAAFNTAYCAGQQVQNAGVTGWDTTGTTALVGNTRFTLTFTDGSCAEIRVFKTPTLIRVTSDGLSDCNAANLRRTQRTIDINFGI